MQEMSWGKLPFYFFRDENSGISINTYALCAGRAAEILPHIDGSRLQNTVLLPHNQYSPALLRGYESMKRQIINAASENNPGHYLSQALYHAITNLHISNMELLIMSEELYGDAEELLIRFEPLVNHGVFCNNTCQIPTDITGKLIILLDHRCGKQGNTLYNCKKELSSAGLAHISILLPAADSYHRGALIALMQMSAIDLRHILDKKGRSD